MLNSDEQHDPLIQSLKEDFKRQNLARVYNEKISACKYDVFFRTLYSLSGAFPEKVATCDQATHKFENVAHAHLSSMKK